MSRIFNSIPIKICLSILIIESILLAFMGIYYIQRFHNEIDSRISEKLILPVTLMSERALSYSSVKDFHILSDLIQEEVAEAFVMQRDGKIFFTADPHMAGKEYIGFLDKKERTHFTDTHDTAQQLVFDDSEGGHYISMMAPIIFKEKILGRLYIKINGEQVAQEKRRVVILFLLGAVVTILLTTVLEALFVYKLVVPRIQATSAALGRMADGDFSARVENPGIVDELGTMMDRVNSMISTIEEHTKKLRVLNMAAEAFAQAGDREEIIERATEVLEQQLPVSREAEQLMVEGDQMPRLGGGRETIFTLPVADDGEKYQVVPFCGTGDYDELTKADQEFVSTLSRMVTVTVDRMNAFLEITEAEGRYRHLFTSAVEGIYRTSLDGRILEANPALAEMTGYESVEEFTTAVAHSPVQLYVDPQDLEKIWEALKNDEIVYNYEILLRRKNGSLFPVSLSAYAVCDDDGQLHAYDVRLSDISERKLLERTEREHLAAEAISDEKSKLVDDLEQKNTQLMEALNELKTTQVQLMQSEKMAAVGMTAGGVAHDLNNILTSMVTYPELLLTRLTPEDQMYAPLSSILVSGRRAATIVADLLTLTQGTVKLKKKGTLEDQVDEYLQSKPFNQLMQAYPGVTCERQYCLEQTAIHCSPVHIQRIVMNLVMNAVEAIGEFGRIVISTALEERISTEGSSSREDSGEGSEKYVVLRIADDGVGIPRENLKHIFEPFYSRKVMGLGGTGLGLTVVWNVVHEHEGTIDVESSEQGTVFTLKFPSVDSDQEEIVSRPFQVENFRGSGSVLVVDDEPLQRDIAGKLLTSFGYEVTVCSSGEEAIEHLSRHPADLVMLDMLMPPGINGLETYRRMLEISPNQKAILVSGYSESKDVKRAMQLGASAFVKKPYTVQQIAQCLQAELAKDHIETTS